ncbi:MAG: hypothetical protein SXA11_03240 [Cyanobacteriota bacterium]|nr:hypothetical protein [Cyanobacteriota bacterium]
MKKLDIYQTLEYLESEELETQVIALEAAAEIVNLFALKTVETFSKAAHKFPLAERLYRFGSIIVPHLEQLLDRTEDSETKILAAVVLLRLGSSRGIDVLLNAISRDEQYPCLAASSLAAAGVKKAINPIGDRLRSATFEEIDLIVGLLTALEELNGEIPADIYRRFTVADAPWQIKFMLENGELNGGRELVLESVGAHYIREINY